MRCCRGAGLVILLTFLAVPTRSDDKDTIMIAQDPGDDCDGRVDANDAACKP